MTVTVHTMDQTKAFAADMLHVLRRGKSTIGATFLALTGPLGSGKTTLVQCLASLLGVADAVTSPTFILRSEYRTADPDFAVLVHIDAYRIDGERDGKTVGWDDFSADRSVLVAVEWPENVTPFLPNDCRRLTICPENEARTFSLV